MRIGGWYSRRTYGKVLDPGPGGPPDGVWGIYGRLGEAAFVELTAMVALENWRSRVNSAFGLTSQGFAETCQVPTRP